VARRAPELERPLLRHRHDRTHGARALRAHAFIDRNPPEIRGEGYVVRSLEAALWAFHRSDSFRDGALLAVNLGDDADTTGAIYGQLAGAYYGEQGIPEAWRTRLAHRELIESFADRLLALRTHLARLANASR